jgi:hypothetical protein
VGVSAQTYSANVVGYINVTCRPNGFTMIANQLNNTNNTIEFVLPKTLPAGLEVWTWGGASFNYATWYGPDDGWDDPSVLLGPGNGAFIKNPFDTNVVVTFVGEVLQGSLSITNVSGFNMIGSAVPTAGTVSSMDLTNNNGIVTLDEVWTWGGASYNFSTFYGPDDGWDDEPSLSVGEGFFVKHSGSPTIWNRYFTVQ